MEKQINRKEIYKGRVIDVVVDDVLIDENTKATREIVLHRGGVCIALEDDDHKLFMVRQYRYAQSEYFLEFCAGKLEKGEDKDEAILRECQEELGYIPKDVKYYGYIVPTCAYSTEKIHLYYGKADKKVSQNFDFDENLEVEKYSLEEIKQLIKEGKIVDAKTIALVFNIENDK